MSCHHLFDTLGAPCYLYLVECDGYYKIGRTEELPVQRLAALQTGSPHPMRLVSFFRGATRLERLFHFKFRALRVRGEWFKKDDAILTEFLKFGQRPACELCA